MTCRDRTNWCGSHSLYILSISSNVIIQQYADNEKLSSMNSLYHINLEFKLQSVQSDDRTSQSKLIVCALLVIVTWCPSACNTSAQRRQTSSCSWWWPTFVLKYQHLSHFLPSAALMPIVTPLPNHTQKTVKNHSRISDATITHVH